MRSRHSRQARWTAIGLLAAAASAACSFVRGFDGFTGGALDGGATDQRDGDLLDGGDTDGDSDAGACTLEVLWAGGNDNPAVGPYLHAVATSTDAVLAVAGAYPGAALEDRTGFLLRVPKGKPGAFERIVTKLDQPVAVVVGGDQQPLVAEEHGARLTRVSADGGLSVLFSGPSVRDVTLGANDVPWLITGSQTNKSFGPLGGASTLETNANRILVRGNTVLVSRTSGDGGLTLYTAGAPSTRICEAASGAVLALAADDTRVAWSTNGTFVAPLGSCATPMQLSDQRALGVGVDATHVVARFAGEVDVYANDGHVVCRQPLVADEPIANSRANATVVVEGKVTYFVSPVRVYRLTLR